jgi:hypothetical protein
MAGVLRVHARLRDPAEPSVDKFDEFRHDAPFSRSENLKESGDVAWLVVHQARLIV